MPTLNLGILAHVDAGKTSLTERLLFDTGVIARLGSVDAGDTQTDTNEIERRRGITIRTAVASFTVGDLQVNLVDTPGHPDFIAEVERALAVLDGAILVLSAVEGVQAQTRILMRALRRRSLPTLIFVNKIDRVGARVEELLVDVRRKLAVSVLPLSSVLAAGTREVRTVPVPDHALRTAEVLAENDDSLLAAVVDGVVPPADLLRQGLADQTARGRLHPVVFGSALLGEGIATLLDALQLLPTATGASGELDGIVFAIDRDRSGKRLAYVRLYSGEIRPRQRIVCQRTGPDGTLRRYTGKVTALDVIGNRSVTLTAGNIARVSGLPEVRVGDRVGAAARTTAPAGDQLPRPALETLVLPRDPAGTTALRGALSYLAERDPFIRTRPLTGGATSVLLYGEVQQQVIAATLRDELGIEATFTPARIVHLERPVGTGEAYEEMSRTGFGATVGLRVAPAPVGSGLRYRVGIEPGWLLTAFHRAIEETVNQALEQGLSGWPVIDCAVTLTGGGYDAATSTAGDFRNLTPLVLLTALAAAGTRVFEPCHWFTLEVPPDVIGTVLTRLAAAEADVRETRPGEASWLLEGEIPARCVHRFQQLLPGLTRGEGAWSSRPYGDRRVTGATPVRERTDGNPLDRQAYLHHLRQRGLR